MNTREVQTVDGKRLLIGPRGVVESFDTACSEVEAAQVEQCRRWFDQARATDEPTVNSFWLQHFIQHWAGQTVSNGAVILAAHQMGFPIGGPPADGSSNVTIGVALECIDEYDCGCGHP